MTDEELKAEIKRMEMYFGTLPSPIHEPIRFKFLIKWWKWKNESSTDK